MVVRPTPWWAHHWRQAHERPLDRQRQWEPQLRPFVLRQPNSMLAAPLQTVHHASASVSAPAAVPPPPPPPPPVSSTPPTSAHIPPPLPTLWTQPPQCVPHLRWRRCPGWCSPPHSWTGTQATGPPGACVARSWHRIQSAWSTADKRAVPWHQTRGHPWWLGELEVDARRDPVAQVRRWASREGAARQAPARIPKT